MNIKKYHILFISALLVLCCTKGFGQDNKYVVDEEVSSYQGVSYTAISSVTLKPGFSFSAAGTALPNGQTQYNFSISIEGQNPPSVDPDLVTRNTVRTDIVKIPGITSITQLAPENMESQLSYMDGLGRPIQRIDIQASPLKKDMVQFMEYDNLGRQPIQYLPYVSTTNSGGYQINTRAAQAAFYQSPSSKVAVDNFPFAVTKFDNSPFERVLESGAPGADWQIGNHTVKSQLRLNTASENIKIWSATGPTSTVYGEGQLSVNETTDENGNKVLQYSNKLGQVVLKKVQADATTYLETAYIYDDLGNVVNQISPEGVKRIKNGTAVWDASFISAWATSYTYDSQGRLVEKTAPGAKPQYLVYDKWDRVVLTQDGNLRKTNKWNFVKYDIINRPVLSGITVNANNRTSIQSDIDASTTYLRFEDRTATTTGYTINKAYPTTITTGDLLTINYYDDYDFDNNGSDDFAYTAPNSTGITNVNNTLAGTESASYKNTMGVVTGSKKLVMGTTTWLTSVIFYDENGNPIQKKGNNLLNAALEDITSNVYDKFSGKVLATKQVKKTSTPTAASISVVNWISYDHRDRVTEVSLNNNGGTTTQVLANYEYNELGQLADKKLHKKTDNTFLQSLDFRYTIRGWLASINNSKLASDGGVTNDDTNDLFGMNFLYNQNDAALNNNQYYNGKIAAIIWKTNDAFSASTNPNYERSYKFTYDGVDRLKAANYSASSGTAWNLQAGAYDETIGSYDANGNILSLQRYTMDNGASARKQIDDLAYNYKTTSGNQLSKVVDAAITTIGFKDVANTGDDYDYDDNGNLISDGNKGSAISYNDLNKTSRVYYAADKYMDYVYDASGVRIRKIVKSGTVITTYDYLDGFVYENSTLSYFPTADGRVRASGSKFEYFIKDHLGNVRVSFEDNGSGVAKIVQENQYYAFGMTMKGIVNRTSVPTAQNKQLFNAGSELQDDLGDETYSTFFREYDPVIGRFNAIDPMVDNYGSWTPYNFAFNDPLGINDPMGAEGTSHQDEPMYSDEYYAYYNRAYSDGYLDPGERMWLNGINGGDGPSDPAMKAQYESFQYAGNTAETIARGARLRDKQQHPTTGGFATIEQALAYGNFLLKGMAAFTNFSDDSGIEHEGGVYAQEDVDGGTQYSKRKGIGQPGLGESLIPIWGSGRSAIDHFQNGNYWRGAAFTVLAISDVFLVKAAITAIAKGTITLAAKYAVKQAVKNPMYAGREFAALANPRIAAMMRGKGIDRAFRDIAGRNLILNPAEKLGLIKLSPLNRGADVVGKGLLKGTWWDVTTRGAWSAHEINYGSGGIGLFY
ncbi:MAG: hypothetical protein JWQ25_2585 [Daejeonella sp.]|nr:hypothetical protein [Daejeonella sp.]